MRPKLLQPPVGDGVDPLAGFGVAVRSKYQPVTVRAS